jgi:hypothetical protein
MEKQQVALLVIAVVCIGLFAYSYYGNRIKKDNELLKLLPAAGGFAYALNFIFNLATQ